MAFGGSTASNTLPHTHNQTLINDGGQSSATLTDMNGVTVFSLINGASGTETHEFTTAETWTPTDQSGIMKVLVDTTLMSGGAVNITIDGVLSETITTATSNVRIYNPTTSITIQTAASLVAPVVLEQLTEGWKEAFTDTSRVGQEFTTGSALIGETITKVLVRIMKEPGGTPTGTITCLVRDSSDNIKLTLGTSNASALTSSYQDFEYENLTGVTIADQDKVCIEFAANLTDTIRVSVINSDVLANSSTWYYNPYTAVWTDRVTYDMYFKYYGVPAFAGTVYGSVSQ